MKKIFLIFIVLSILGAFFCFGYPIVKNRYFKSEDAPGKNSPIKNETGSEKNATTENKDGNTQNGQPAEEIEDSEPQEVPEISESDCENECETYQDNSEKLLYCQEVCGLKKSKVPADFCDGKTGSEKDYCWKDKAVGAQDFEICEKISDARIKKTCQNRIAEELLEESGLEE